MSKPTQKFETKGQYTLKMYITPYKNKEKFKETKNGQNHTTKT